MNDSNEPDSRLSTDDRSEQRVERIKRWVDYIRHEPPETWGPQQNAVVNDQLDAAESVRVSATDRQHVAEVAAEIIEERGDAETDSV